MMLPSLRDGAWFLRRRHRAVLAVSREEQGMQWSSGTLSHTGHDSVLLKSPVGFHSGSCIPSVLPGEPWCSCSVPPQRRKPRGRSGKDSQGEGAKGWQRDWGEAAGNSVQESNLLKFGFAHLKPTADPIQCLWVCQLTASWLPTGWKETPASHCHPCLLPLLYQLTHCQRGKPSLGDTTSLSLWEGPQQNAFYPCGVASWWLSKQDGHCWRRFNKLCTSSTLQPPCTLKLHAFWPREQALLYFAFNSEGLHLNGLKFSIKPWCQLNNFYCHK